MGSVISDRGLLMDPEGQSAVLNWPSPVGLHAIQWFCRLLQAIYPILLHLGVSPLGLTKKGSNPQIWAPQAEDALSHYLSD